MDILREVWKPVAVVYVRGITRTCPDLIVQSVIKNIHRCNTINMTRMVRVSKITILWHVALIYTPGRFCECNFLKLILKVYTFVSLINEQHLQTIFMCTIFTDFLVWVFFPNMKFLNNIKSNDIFFLKMNNCIIFLWKDIYLIIYVNPSNHFLNRLQNKRAATQ